MAQETFTLTLDSFPTSVDVTINDTSQSPASPSYTLVANPTSVNEGQSATWTLTTQNVAAGTTLAYTISGVNSADIGGAATSGNFVVGSTMSRTVTFANDFTSEGTEVAQLRLNNNQASANVTVGDTSSQRNIISTRISTQVFFRTDPYPGSSNAQQTRLSGAMTNYGSVRPFRTVAFFQNDGGSDVLQAWYDWGTYSPSNCYVGSNYDSGIGYYQVLIWVSGTSGNPAYYQLNGSAGFNYNRIKLYSGGYGTGQLAYLTVP